MYGGGGGGGSSARCLSRLVNWDDMERTCFLPRAKQRPYADFPTEAVYILLGGTAASQRPSQMAHAIRISDSNNSSCSLITSGTA